jgi:hypothetical protein
MPLAKLPVPVKRLLRAFDVRDFHALLDTLAVDAALIDAGRPVPNDAIRVWSQSLLSDANFALYPTYAIETGPATTLIVMRQNTGHCTNRAEMLQQRWRFLLSEDKIDMLIITPEPLPGLPAAVAAYINATNAVDVSALLATFADDALVNDQFQDFWGKPAIGEWAARDIIGARLTMYVFDVVEHHENVVVTAYVDGDLDKRGLPDPLALAFHFSLRGTQIVRLIILQNRAGT